MTNQQKQLIGELVRKGDPPSAIAAVLGRRQLTSTMLREACRARRIQMRKDDRLLDELGPFADPFSDDEVAEAVNRFARWRRPKPMQQAVLF